MDFTPCGFPHSEIRGSKAICALPRLIAACHVLLRLPVPRHPPCALSCLTFVIHSLCNLVLSCSLCVLNLSLHEFCKTTFVPTYIFTRQNCFCNNLFSNLNSFPYCCLLNSFLLFSSQGTFLFYEPRRFSTKLSTKPFGFAMGSSGLEPPTSRLSGARSNRLSYEPLSVNAFPVVPRGSLWR